MRSLRNDDGAVLPWVALMLTAMLGIVGLSFDLGRHYVVSTELQKAADAAALAGAYQLDPTVPLDDTTASDGTVTLRGNTSRVARAVPVGGAPITGNASRLATVGTTIEIDAVRLLDTIPDDDDADTSGEPAGINYVEVTTAARTSNNVFSRVAGSGPSVTMTRTAIARRGQAVCQATPLFICNPNEAVDGAGAGFDPTEWYGKQIVSRLGPGSGAAWQPGNFGFLENDASGARALSEALAGGTEARCFGNQVTTKPGQTTGPAHQGLNTRFNDYSGPMNSRANKAAFLPADNVHAMPRDQYIREQQAGGSNTVRFGDGYWDCAGYWTSNGLGATPPTWCTAATGTTAGTGTYGHSAANPPSNDPSVTPSRYNVYRHVAGLSACQSSTSCAPANGVTPTTGQPTSDRRIITMAVANCLAESFSGSTELNPIAYLNAFITEPIPAPGPSGDQGDIYLEIIGSSSKENAGAVPVVMREWVEVVR